MPWGTRYQVNTPGSNKRRTIFGAVNLLSGQFHYHLAVKGVAVVYCYFLDLLLAAYPDAPVNLGPLGPESNQDSCIKDTIMKGS